MPICKQRQGHDRANNIAISANQRIFISGLRVQHLQQNVGGEPVLKHNVWQLLPPSRAYGVAAYLPSGPGAYIALVHSVASQCAQLRMAKTH